MTQSPSPSVDEAVEAACRGYWPLHWDDHMDANDKIGIRRNMANALKAASLVSPPKAGAGEHKTGWETMHEALPFAFPLDNHEARRDGVRVTDGMLEAARSAHAAAVREWQRHPEGLLATLPNPMRDALDAAFALLPPLGEGSAEIVETSVDDFVAAVVALGAAGIEADMQEVLVRGNPMRNIKPNALLNAIEAYNRATQYSLRKIYKEWQNEEAESNDLIQAVGKFLGDF